MGHNWLDIDLYFNPMTVSIDVSLIKHYLDSGYSSTTREALDRYLCNYYLIDEGISIRNMPDILLKLDKSLVESKLA